MTSSAVDPQPIPVPTAQQLAWQRLGLGIFWHFGINTFHAKEWSDGTLPAASFDPPHLDPGQWVRAAKSWGARYVVLTAKHHDGFCLWPTATTCYSVASTPWYERDRAAGGDGDLVGQVAAACRANGLGLGLYLSPWDRHEPSYLDPAAYDDFYAAQLTELCSRYGPLVELWFDGAGSEGRVYDWPRYMDIARRLQPGAMIFNMGQPTIRWVGNENGLAGDPVYYAAARTKTSNYTQDHTALGEQVYLPPECDVSLRRGWFWAPHDGPKTVEHLLAIYLASVGRGCNLLLNVPPAPTGRLDPADVAVMDAWARRIARAFGNPVEGTVVPAPGLPANPGSPNEPRIYHVLLPDAAAHRPLPASPGRKSAEAIDAVELVEELGSGQRITGFRLSHQGVTLAQGHSVGVRRIELLPGPVTQLEVEVYGPGATLAAVRGYATGAMRAPHIPAGYEAPTDYPD